MNQSIVFFDDICLLCSWSVRFIYRNDSRGKFHFASLDSPYFEELIQSLDIEKDSLTDSLVLYCRGKLYTQSAAALRIAVSLRFPLPLLAIFFVIPRFLRNSVYDFIARYRYRWYGKSERCFMPEGGLKERFIDMF